MKNICAVCGNEVCICEWSLDELFESWGLNSNSILDIRYSGSNSDCDDTTDSCFGLSVFDSVYANATGSIPDPYLSDYKGPVIGEAAYRVGDLVVYHPLWGLVDWNKPWIVRKVFCIDPLDCSFYDYEITDGQETHLVTHYEINKMEDK